MSGKSILANNSLIEWIIINLNNIILMLAWKKSLFKALDENTFNVFKVKLFIVIIGFSSFGML